MDANLIVPTGDSACSSSIRTLLRSAPPWLPDRLILLTRTGSCAYGLAVEASDHDLRGVAVAPLPYYLGFAKGFERYVFDGATEGEVEDVRVFMRAACNGEPQVMPALFCDEDDVLACTLSGSRLRASAPLFLSKCIAKPFAGQVRSIVMRAERTKVTPKQAMTAVRLIRMLAEILVAGKVCVWRYDAEDLLAIRRGERSVEDALSEARAGLDGLAGWLAKTSLPEQPDRGALDRLCCEIVQAENPPMQTTLRVE